MQVTAPAKPGVRMPYSDLALAENIKGEVREEFFRPGLVVIESNSAWKKLKEIFEKRSITQNGYYLSRKDYICIKVLLENIGMKMRNA